MTMPHIFLVLLAGVAIGVLAGSIATWVVMKEYI